MDLQIFLDACGAFLGNLTEVDDALKATLLFYSIDIAGALDETSLVSDMTQISNWPHHLGYLCCEIGRRLFIGDMYPFQSLPPLSLEYQAFAKTYERLVLMTIIRPGFTLGMEPSILRRLRENTFGNTQVFNRARDIAFEKAQKAGNLIDITAFVNAVCRVTLELYSL